MNKQVVHLHNHSTHSFLDGQASITNMLDRAKELGFESIALTNHGNVFGIPEFYQECQKRGIKSILGCEFYLVDNVERSRDEKDRHAHHLVVLAENETGWKNICKLTTLANQNFYYKPRIDVNMLRDHRDGLIVLTACMHGPVSYWLFDKMTWPKDGEESQLKEAANIPKAYDFARSLQDALGPDRLYLEVQDGGIPEQKIINARVRKMAQELGLQTVATQDAHYVYPEDSEAHGILKAIGFGKTAIEEGSHGFSTNEFYLKTADEMLRGDLTEEEIARTVEISNRCDVKLDLHQNRLPKYPYSDGKTSLELLKEKVNKGWKARKITDPGGEYKARVIKEVSDIESAGLEDYFLIVADITDFCHNNSIRLGSARGSAGGSLVSYLLGITDLDPIKYGLMWERFYNAGRKGSMPDIDTDVEKSRRDEVLDYIRSRFGENRVAQLVTLSSLGAKGILKDVLRVIGIDFDTANKISGLVPAKNEDHGSISLSEACQAVPALKEYADNDQEFEIIKDNRVIRRISWKKIFEIANKLEGCYKTAGMHAAAVVIADQDFSDAGIPLVKGTTKENLICGWDMDAVDAFGLLKVDILGLATLSVINTCLRLIKERHGIDIEIEQIPLDDPKVGRLISSGYNEGIFQLESTLGKGWSKKCQPGLFDPAKTIEEIAELVAIIRPACLETGMSDTYAKIKSGEESPTYIHQLLEPILAPTKGILLYQEQVMAICQSIAGMDLKEADAVRKTIGKKKPEELRQKKQQFMDGSRGRVPEDIADEIWGWIEKQAGYGFNKSHAVGYAMMAYRTAWLKANYYIEFLCANLMHAKDKANQQRTPHDVIASFINDAKLNDVHMIPPTLTESEDDFKIIDDHNIVFGFEHIKGVGKSAIAAIRKCRDAESFDEFTILARSSRLNRQVIESFICAGVLDQFGMTRRSMRNQYRLLEALTDKERDNLRKLPSSLTPLQQIKMLGSEDHVDEVKKMLGRGPNISRREKLRDVVQEFSLADHNDTMPQILLWEQEYLGTTISGSPADLQRAMRARNSCIELGRGDILPDSNVELCVVVETIREHIIKKGKFAGQPMAFLTISDSTYRLDNVTVFNKEYLRVKGQVETGDVIAINGRMSDRGLVANKIRRL